MNLDDHPNLYHYHNAANQDRGIETLIADIYVMFEIAVLKEPDSDSKPRGVVAPSPVNILVENQTDKYPPLKAMHYAAPT